MLRWYWVIALRRSQPHSEASSSEFTKRIQAHVLLVMEKSPKTQQGHARTSKRFPTDFMHSQLNLEALNVLRRLRTNSKWRTQHLLPRLDRSVPRVGRLHAHGEVRLSGLGAELSFLHDLDGEPDDRTVVSGHSGEPGFDLA